VNGQRRPGQYPFIHARARVRAAAHSALGAGLLLAAAARLARRVEPGSLYDGLTLTTTTAAGETVVYGVELGPAEVSRAILDVTGPGAPVLVELDGPEPRAWGCGE
jgi:hypothetical protein